MDDYQAKYIKRIKESQNDDDLEQVVDDIYHDGFQDKEEE